MSTVFREPDTTEKSKEPVVDNKFGYPDEVEDYKPIEDDQDILNVLGIEDDIKVLPEEDYQDLQELKGYLSSYMEEKGLPKTFKGMEKGIKALKEVVGLDEDADPQAVVKRIGGIARSWKELSFV